MARVPADCGLQERRAPLIRIDSGSSGPRLRRFRKDWTNCHRLMRCIVISLRVRICRPLALPCPTSTNPHRHRRQSSRLLWSGRVPMERVVAVMVDKHWGNMVLGSAVLSAMAGVMDDRLKMVAGPHRVEGYARVPEWAGIDIPRRPPHLLPTAQDQDGWHEFARSAALAPGEPFACLRPGGGQNEKCWPEDRFAALTFRLRRKGLRSLLVGGKPTLARAGRIPVDSAPGTLDASGRSPFGVLPAGLSRCSVFVGNDSGPAHLAAVVGAPAVVLFGPTDPGEWAPLGKSVSVVRGDRHLLDGPAANGSVDARRMDSILLDVVSLAALRLARRSRYPEDPSLDLETASRYGGEVSMGGAR
jgi:hypothetical protein